MYNRCGFFSYRRGARADNWYERSKNQVEAYIQTGIGHHDIPMFFDRTTIPSGSYWRDQLQIGLDRSPVLVAFFSLAYFDSPWCVAELRTFMDREDTLGLPRGSLIHAARIQDADHFPGWVREIQSVSFQNYYVILPSFWETTKAADFSDNLREFAGAAVAKVRNMPPWDVNFPKLDAPVGPAATDDAAGLPGFAALPRDIPQPFADRMAA